VRAARRGAGLAPLIAALGLLAGAGGARADGPTYHEYAWPRGERIVDHEVFDLNGDGRKDLTLVRGRRVSIYLQDAKGRFHPSDPRHQRFNFIDKAILWTFADVDGDGRAEVLFLARDGVYYYRWRRTHLSFVPRLLFRTKTILTTASREEVRRKDFYLDLDGDGVRDLLLPGDAALVLYRGLPGRKFAPPERLSMRPDVAVSVGSNLPTAFATSHYWYAQPRVGDWNGDGRQDILIYQRQQAVVFLQREKGARFGPNPDLVMPVTYTGPLTEGRFKLDRELPTEFVDLQGDGLVDVVATHMGRATTHIYYGKKGRTALKRPDLLLRLPGVTFLHFVVDLDGDGRQDLILARTDRPGLLDIVKVLITKEVPVELLFYYGRKVGGFPRQPDERRDLDIPILFSSARRGLNVGTSAVLSVLGDFDGDGMRDLLLRSSSDELAVFRGEGRKFADDETITISVQTMDGYRFLEPETVDLNGDGRSDLVLTYYSWDQKHDRISILVSEERQP